MTFSPCSLPILATGMSVVIGRFVVDVFQSLPSSKKFLRVLYWRFLVEAGEVSLVTFC